MTTQNASAAITASLSLTAGVIPRGITLINGFEGGVNGSVVGPFNSGGASGNPWDVNHTGGTGTALAYDSTQAAHGILSCQVIAPNTSQYLAWATTMLTAQANQPQVWFRLYLYFAVAPGFTHTVFEALSGATSAARVNVNADGTLSLAGSGGAAITGMTTTATIPVNQWFRVEGYVAGGPASQVSLSLFTSLDSTFATETKSAGNANTAGPLTEWRFGCTRAPGTGNTAAFWMDDCGLSNTGALGPVLYGFAPVRTDDGGAVTGVAVSAPGGLSGAPLGGAAGGLVGSTTTTGLYPTDGNTRLGAATAADSATGRPMVLAAQKLYYGNVPPNTITDGQGATLQPLADAGCFFWICIEPDIHGADTTTMVARLTTWIAAMPGGAGQLGVIFYQEVQDKLTPGDYLTCCQNNSPAVHGLGLPVAYDIAGHTNTSQWTSYYPGDAYVDVVGVDIYAANWNQKYDPVTNPDPLLPAHNLATTHGKPFGVFEMGSSVQSNTGTGTVTQPGFILYIQSIQGVMTALPAASRSDCMWYSGDHNGPGSNVISGPQTTIAAGSSGGPIKNIATWSHPSPGVLAAANIATAGFGTGVSAGNLYIQCDDNTVARIYYTGISGNTFTGCTYIDTFPAGGSGNTTVSAGNFLAVWTFAPGVTTDFRVPYVQAFFDTLTGTPAVAAGGDVEGFFTTADGGQHWQVANTGLYGVNWRRVACIQWSVYEANTLYAGVGLNGAGGGFLAGPAAGASWTLRSSTPQYSGNTTNISGDAARSAGNLLAQAGTPLAPVMYTATYKQGVYRSKSVTSPGASWTNIGLATLPGGGTAYGRSIAVDPANKDIVYVAMYGAGIFKATNASTATPANFTHLAGSPAQTEEVIVLASGNIYAAAGNGGLYLSGDNGTSWTQMDPTGGHLSHSSYWLSLDGYTDTTGLDQLIVGCNSPVQAPSPAKGYRTLMWVTVSTLGVPTFSDLTASVPSIGIATIPPDPGRSWWHTATSVPFPSQAITFKEWLGGPGYFQPHPAIDQSTVNGPNVTFYVAGSCGVWSSAGNTVAASGPVTDPQWNLAINGMPVFIGHQIAVDPNNALHLTWATRDWGCFDITDGTGYNAVSTIQTKPSTPSTGGYAVAYDPVASTVYLSTGAKGANSGGQIWARLAGTYNYANISAAGTTNPGGNVAYGLAGGRGSGGLPYLLAIIQGTSGGSGTGGMYKCSGGSVLSASSTWSRVDSVIGTSSVASPTGLQAPIIIDPANPATAYCFDQGRGVFRSTNYGGAWTQIYTAVNTDSRSGHIALSPVTPNELWVSWQGAGASGGLFRISNANVGGSPTAVAVTGIDVPGGICFAPNGDLYCLSLGGAAPLSPNTALMASTDKGTTWLPADNGSVAASASYPSNMVYAAGRLYIANEANIAAYGYPSLPVGAATAVFTMTMSLAADGQDVSGPLKHGTANIAMTMHLAAAGGTTGQATAQIQMTLALTTSGGIQALVVQQVSGTATFDYGSAGVEMTTTTGDTLVLLAGWDLTTGATAAAMPSAYVHDSAGNYWYHVATTTAGVPGCRSSAWICPNAGAIEWLSVSLTSFASSLAYTVIELGGMPPLYSLDIADATASSSAAALALAPGTTTGAGFAFSVFATGALTPPPLVPAGWNALNSVATPGGANPVQIFPYFTTPPAGTDLNITYTVDQAVPVSGVTFAVHSAVYPPPQADPSFPLLKVEAGFGFTPGDPSQPPPAWTDITNRVIGPPGQACIDITAGRQYEQGTAEAGVMEIWLDNHTGDFTPGNIASEYWPDVVLETPIRVSAFWQGSWFNVGYGYVERWPQEWPDLPQWGISKMVATDAISVLAAVTMLSALDSDILLDAPYVLLSASEQYLSFSNGLNSFGGSGVAALGYYRVADAQGLLAQNFSRDNQRTGTYVDGNSAGTGGGGPAIAATGQTTNLLGSANTGFGTSAISTPPTTPSAGPGIIYTDPNLPGPLTGDGVTVTFWVIIPATVATANLQPVVFTAYGPPSNYLTANASLTVQILNETGGSTLQVTLADGSAVSAPFSAGPAAQAITLVLTTSTLAIYVNGTQAAASGLSPAQVTAWTAVALGCPNYAYQSSGLVTGSFTAFDLAIFPYPLATQRIQSQFVTGSFGQQNADAIARVAQIVTWAGLGIPVAGRMTFGGIPDGVLQGPAYNLAGATAADAVSQVAANHNTMAAAMPDGTLVYIHKWALFNQSPVAVLGDSPVPGGVPFLPAETFDYDDTYLYNTSQVTQQYGANNLFTATATDFGSQKSYFARSAGATTITTMNALDATGLANWKTTKYAQPGLRVAGLTIDAAANPQAAFPVVLNLQQGQVATVTRDPVGAAVISENTLIQKIQHQIGPGLWKTSLQLSPYTPENSVLELDAPPFSSLGNVTLA